MDNRGTSKLESVFGPNIKKDYLNPEKIKDINSYKGLAQPVNGPENSFEYYINNKGEPIKKSTNFNMTPESVAKILLGNVVKSDIKGNPITVKPVKHTVYNLEEERNKDKIIQLKEKLNPDPKNNSTIFKPTIKPEDFKKIRGPIKGFDNFTKCILETIKETNGNTLSNILSDFLYALPGCKVIIDGKKAKVISNTLKLGIEVKFDSTGYIKKYSSIDETTSFKVLKKVKEHGVSRKK